MFVQRFKRVDESCGTLVLDSLDYRDGDLVEIVAGVARLIERDGKAVTS